MVQPMSWKLNEGGKGPTLDKQVAPDKLGSKREGIKNAWGGIQKLSKHASLDIGNAKPIYSKIL